MFILTVGDVIAGVFVVGFLSFVGWILVGDALRERRKKKSEAQGDAVQD